MPAAQHRHAWSHQTEDRLAVSCKRAGVQQPRLFSYPRVSEKTTSRQFAGVLFTRQFGAARSYKALPRSHRGTGPGEKEGRSQKYYARSGREPVQQSYPHNPYLQGNREPSMVCAVPAFGAFALPTGFRGTSIPRGYCGTGGQRTRKGPEPLAREPRPH
jgi:hypothetical protein